MATEREALRIALPFAAALVIAEVAALELSFLAPLMAGTMAVARTRAVTLLALPPLGAVLVGAAALLGDAGLRHPLPLGVVLFGIFTLGFAMSARRAAAPAGLMVLATFAVLPDILARRPEVAGDLTGWIAGNIAIASLCVLASHALFPCPAAEPRAEDPAPPLPPARAAAALLAVVIAVWASQPANAAPILVSVIILLRADGGVLGSATDRLLGALAGGVLAAGATLAVEMAPTLPVLVAATLAFCWPAARGIAAGGRWEGASAKALNALAILQGQALSRFYADVDEGFGIRLGGVLLGLGAAFLLILLLRGEAPSRRAARCPATADRSVAAARR